MIRRLAAAVLGWLLGGCGELSTDAATSPWGTEGFGPDADTRTIVVK